MLECAKLTIVELDLSELVDFLPVDKETDFLTSEAEKEADYIDNNARSGLYIFNSWLDFKTLCPICYGVVSSVVTLTDIDQIHIWC